MRTEVEQLVHTVTIHCPTYLTALYAAIRALTPTNAAPGTQQRSKQRPSASPRMVRHSPTMSPWSPTSDLFKCPFPACQWQSQQLIGQHRNLRTHISLFHTHELHVIPSQTLTSLKVFPCYSCCTLCSSQSALLQHNTNKHPTTQTNTNIAIVQQTYRHLQTLNNNQNWTTTLQWLHNLDIPPSPNQHSEWHYLQPSTKQAYHTVLHNVVSWANQATLPVHPDPPAPTHQCTATPFYKLLLILEQLLLYPIPKKQLRH